MNSKSNGAYIVPHFLLLRYINKTQSFPNFVISMPNEAIRNKLTEVFGKNSQIARNEAQRPRHSLHQTGMSDVKLRLFPLGVYEEAS